MRSIRGLALLTCIAACYPKGPPRERVWATAPDATIDLAPGSFREISMASKVTSLTVHAPARVVVVQGHQARLRVAVGPGSFPRTVLIPVQTFQDLRRSYVVVLPPAREAMEWPSADILQRMIEGKCMTCNPCCPPPPPALRVIW